MQGYSLLWPNQYFIELYSTKFNNLKNSTLQVLPPNYITSGQLDLMVVTAQSYCNYSHVTFGIRG